ncbi:MAG: radical SAM family heme chaperone HemW [Alphaproteobacteria bacterium]|nr:radical SAM family heme chaperone HemW [Alphaproteobacteria bacterium]
MKPLALYIHWPFCLAKCPYCDFNSHVNARIDERRMVNALLSEMRYWHERINARPLTSIFFGGGTPSLLAPSNVALLLNEAQKCFGFAADIEITLEANPTSSEAEKFKGFEAAGINRLSIGVQSLNDADLKALGREHSVAEAIGAIEMAQRIFRRHSFDLIYARKNQTLQQWEHELRDALKLAAAHLSLYQLTIEPGTVFAQKTAAGQRFTAQDDVADEMYRLTQDICADAGLPAYEVSNHARRGEESRHNLSYWHYDEYIGIGPGAHGRVRMGRVSINDHYFSTNTLRAPEMWLREVEAKKIGLETQTELSQKDQKTEHLLMNLRLFSGIDKADWQVRYGEPLDAFLNKANKNFYISEHFLIEDDKVLRATPQGMMMLNALTEKLVA